ncbi:glycerophosphodiester phosphodiesterase family protein [Henriciella sp.]|uniref:glycerophosphodiester phosphodiesterase family protein n=1 Tax=Henriciella sp. TaxID=1968823 RepID=UPI002608742D|nr:glycerophosphodiester phosphodiesterase family protein [Henriciella sp.]
MKCPKSLVFAAIGAGLLAACEQTAPPETYSEPGGEMTSTDMDADAGDVQSGETKLATLFDCVREEGGLLLAAHRGGPAPGYPKNAIETLDHALSSAAFVMEVDIAESRDGTLFLMHDRTLGRTTSGSGAVADTDWAAIASLDLVDNEGTVTDFNPPTLDAALDWAVENDAILELDRKETTSFRKIVSAVRDAGATSNVILITYNDDQARQVAKLAPEMMMTAGIGGPQHEAELLESGIDPDNLIAWTGTSTPVPGKWKALAGKGIESAFGTLGRPGERLDDQYWADDDPSEYSELARGGLTMLATDEPYRLARADGWIGTAQDIARKECMGDFRD